ncbi:MAG: NfeD family protein, partial [Acidimicrobiales bacterium]
SRMRSLAGIVWRTLVLFAVLLTVVGVPSASAQDDQPGPVHVIEVRGTIDLGLAPFLDRALDEAERAAAEAVIIEIDTFGGRLDAVIQMRDSLIDSPLRTVALVDATAFSAGALVAIAAEEIWMSPGSTMGAATPVEGTTGEVADEKTISAVRATFESTAEERGRDPRVAAAMVDGSVEIEGLVEEGRLLTLTVSQAEEFGYADGLAADRSELLEELGLADRELIELSPSFVEQLARFITNPVVASLLLLAGMLAVLTDLLSGGLGIGVVAGLGLLGLFFWGHMLAGLAGWEDLALVVLGLLLMAVEIFVFPGFGVAGILGLLALGAGAFLAMIFREFDFVTNEDLVRAALTVSLTLVAVVVGTIVLIATVARRGPPSGLVLRPGVGAASSASQRPNTGWVRWLDVAAKLPSDRAPTDGARRDGTADVEADGGSPAATSSLVGRTGTALSDLRPSGVADLDGERVDVVTAGDYVRRGEPIEVIVDEGYRRVVRRIDT